MRFFSHGVNSGDSTTLLEEPEKKESWPRYARRRSPSLNVIGAVRASIRWGLEEGRGGGGGRSRSLVGLGQV